MTDLSANGDGALFEDGEFAKGRAYMFLRRTDASAPVQLGQGTPAGLSPDSRWALGFPRAEGDYQRRLVVVATGAGQGHELPRGTIDRYLDAFWFPDGKKVLIVGQEKDRPLRLFEQAAEKGEPRPVTPEGVATSHPTLTPDGTAVLAAAFEAGSLFRLYPLNGGEGKAVPGVRQGDTPLRFDGTGRFVFVREPVAPEEGRAAIVRVDTRSAQRERWLDLHPANRVAVGSVPMVRLSADGRSYVYTYSRDLSNLFLVNGLR